MTKVVQQIFGIDCRIGCVHKQGCENEGVPTILRRIQHTLHKDRVAVDHAV